MKKFILIAVIVIVAVIGLTSYNGKAEVKSGGDDRLIAQIRTMKQGDPVTGTTPIVIDKKKPE